jgi:hypothetical protein
VVDVVREEPRPPQRGTGACLPPAPPSKTKGRNDSGEHTSGPSSDGGRLEPTPDAGGTKPVAGLTADEKRVRTKNRRPGGSCVPLHTPFSRPGVGSVAPRIVPGVA